MRLAALLTASCCLAPLAAQSGFTEAQRAELREIIRSEIRAAMQELHGAAAKATPHGEAHGIGVTVMDPDLTKLIQNVKALQGDIAELEIDGGQIRKLLGAPALGKGQVIELRDVTRGEAEPRVEVVEEIELEDITHGGHGVLHLTPNIKTDSEGRITLHLEGGIGGLQSAKATKAKNKKKAKKGKPAKKAEKTGHRVFTIVEEKKPARVDPRKGRGVLFFSGRDGAAPHMIDLNETEGRKLLQLTPTVRGGDGHGVISVVIRGGDGADGAGIECQQLLLECREALEECCEAVEECCEEAEECCEEAECCETEATEKAECCETQKAEQAECCEQQAKPAPKKAAVKKISRTDAAQRSALETIDRVLQKIR